MNKYRIQKKLTKSKSCNKGMNLVAVVAERQTCQNSIALRILEDMINNTNIQLFCSTRVELLFTILLFCQYVQTLMDTHHQL